MMKTLKLLFAVAILLATTHTYSQTNQVDTDKSSVKWEGKKIGGSHNGAILLKEGSFTLKGSKITEGTFIIDMASISNADIEDKDYKAKLIGHLKSDDFFSVEKYPTATLKVTGSTAFKNDIAKVTGDLTIKGQTHPIDFEVSKNGHIFTTQLTVDRAQYDIRYGSKSFFDNLGDKVIYDDFTLDISIVTK
ncbi:YceI family protein [Saccharicrinis fermentans]|nr:YceI family protein [Saccharicrinis fermentans]